MHRPAKLTIAALLLAWLGCGGFAIALWANLVSIRLSAQLAFAGVGLAYGLTAFWAAASIWRMRRSAKTAIRAWAIVSLVASWLPQLIVLNDPPLWVAVVGTAFTASVLVLIVWFLERALVATV